MTSADMTGIAIALPRGGDRSEPRAIMNLPERLPQSAATALAASDAAAVFAAALLTLNGGQGDRIAAAVCAALLVCGSFWLGGLYHRSLAVYGRDEAYFACAGVLLAAVPAIALLRGVAGIPVASVLLMLAAAAALTSFVHVRANAIRRKDVRAVVACLASVTARAWRATQSPARTIAKRAFDYAVATIGCIAASPFMAVAALAIAAESGAPLLFRQDRVGEGGRVFSICKFRTMRPNAGAQWAKPGDSRITRTGAFLRRTSLDELPQLANVLAGDMSIVGPRPEMVSFAERFAEQLPSYRQRHMVRPGITGWAQLYLKRNLDPGDAPDVLAYDLFYVEHASLILDTALVLKTAVEVLFHRAI